MTACTAPFTRFDLIHCSGSKYVTEVTSGFYSFQECTMKESPYKKYNSITFDVMTMTFRFSDGGYAQARL